MSPVSTSLSLYLPLCNSLSLILDRNHCLVESLTHFTHCHSPYNRKTHYIRQQTHQNTPVDQIRHFGSKKECPLTSSFLLIISMNYMIGTRSLARENETRTIQPIRNNFTFKQGGQLFTHYPYEIWSGEIGPSTLAAVKWPIKAAMNTSRVKPLAQI